MSAALPGRRKLVKAAQSDLKKPIETISIAKDDKNMENNNMEQKTLSSSTTEKISEPSNLTPTNGPQNKLFEKDKKMEPISKTKLEKNPNQNRIKNKDLDIKKN